MPNEIVRPEAQVTVFGVQARAHNVVQNTEYEVDESYEVTLVEEPHAPTP